MNKAVVVFLGEKLVSGHAWYARWLKPGFTHCFCLIEAQGKWIKFQGVNGRVEVTYLGEVSNVASSYIEQGATVVETVVRLESNRSPLAVKSCVGLVKVLLGLSSWAMTPFGLYKYLKEDT